MMGVLFQHPSILRILVVQMSQRLLSQLGGELYCVGCFGNVSAQ
jgi:hypothetical protein